MLRLFTLLTGDRYDLLIQHGPASRKKVVASGSGLLLVTGLWLFTGFNIGINAFGMRPWQALMVGAALSTVVFIVDRMLMLGLTVQGAVVKGRFFLATLMAIVGGIGLDLHILRAEIEQTLLEVHRDAQVRVMEAVQDRHTHKLDAAQLMMTQARSELAAAELDWRQEMDGAAGSRRYGVGPVARAKAEIVEERRKALRDAHERVRELEQALAEEQRISAAELLAAQRQGGLFDRIHALHAYIVKDRTVLAGYLIITLILVLIELSPLLVKIGFPKTAYERGLDLADRLQQERMDTIAGIHRRFDQRDATLAVDEHRARARLQAITKAYYNQN